MGIREVLQQRQEFSTSRMCPACGGYSSHLRYTEGRHLRDQNGQLSHEVTQFGEVDPHLIVSCTGCGAEWEMETYT